MFELTVVIGIILLAILLVFRFRQNLFKQFLSNSSGFYQGILTIASIAAGKGGFDSNGERNITIVGTITGPGIAPTEIYTQLVLPATFQLKPGCDIAVQYKPKDVHSTWRFAG